MYDDEHAPDEQDAENTVDAPAPEPDTTPTPNVDKPHPGDDALDEAHARPIGELDDHATDVTPEVGIAESLRNALGSMREEADRIAALGTGAEQVEAAERFAEDAGKLDEQVGTAARDADGDER